MQQLESVNNEKSAQEIVKKEKDKEILSLKQRLKEGEESRKKILNELEAARVEARKQGVLTLEMRDYEVCKITFFASLGKRCEPGGEMLSYTRR